MAVKVKDDGSVVIRTAISLKPGRDDELISLFHPVEPLNVAGTIREAMRGGVVKFEKAEPQEAESINLDIGLEI